MAAKAARLNELPVSGRALIAWNVEVGRIAHSRRGLLDVRDGSKAAIVRRRSSIARPSHRICVVSQRLCVGRPLLSQTMCVENRPLLRVEALIIARRYTTEGTAEAGQRFRRSVSPTSNSNQPDTTLTVIVSPCGAVPTGPDCTPDCGSSACSSRPSRCSSKNCATA